MQTSSIRRQMKNMVNNYTEAEVKVREATSNDPWGPSSSLMSEIADLTFNVVAFTEVMGIIWKRINDHGKNWRHVYKALMLLDYLVKTGSERVVKACKENIHHIQTLKDFQYIDRDGHDQGVNIREKAKRLVSLLKDEEKLKKERSQALKTKSRMAGVSTRTMSSSSADDFGFSRSQSSSSYPVAASRLAPDLEQALPATSGEEELQLQLALAMSREESEKTSRVVVKDDQAELQLAISRSKEETKKAQPVRRPPSPAPEMDEDAQLELAITLSKKEHQQEQLNRRGDDLELQKALEESKREMESRGGGTAFMDLVDVFATPADPGPSDYRWNNRPPQAGASAPGIGGSDPWDSLDGSQIPRADSPWMAPPPSYSPPPPWEPPTKPLDSTQSMDTKPWEAPRSNNTKGWDPPQSINDKRWDSPKSLETKPWDLPQSIDSRPWDAPHSIDSKSWDPSQSVVCKPSPSSKVRGLPTNSSSLGPDPFLTPSDSLVKKSSGKEPALRSGSPSDGDLFDEAMDGGQLDINGRGDGSPELFDLTRLRDGLPEPKPRKCKTPEQFLGPTAAPLVDLDNLIPTNPTALLNNPFLSGLGASTVNNPFQAEQPKVAMNQMGAGSLAAAANASSLPYSASLPLPISSQAPAIPSSLTHPVQPPLNLPRTLPEPLLPFSSSNPQASQSAQSNQNPFLD